MKSTYDKIVTRVSQHKRQRLCIRNYGTHLYLLEENEKEKDRKKLM